MVHLIRFFDHYRYHTMRQLIKPVPVRCHYDSLFSDGWEMMAGLLVQQRILPGIFCSAARSQLDDFSGEYPIDPKMTPACRC
jgi:hypothetical protein